MGGDEVNLGSIANLPEVVAAVKRKGVADVADLYRLFIVEMNTFARGLNKTLQVRGPWRPTWCNGESFNCVCLRPPRRDSRDRDRDRNRGRSEPVLMRSHSQGKPKGFKRPFLMFLGLGGVQAAAHYLARRPWS